MCGPTEREPDEADEMRIDLDPTPGVTFDQVREAAALVRDYLAELGMLGFAKTTGSKGIHIYVRVEPGWDSFAIRGASHRPRPRIIRTAAESHH